MKMESKKLKTTRKSKIGSKMKKVYQDQFEEHGYSPKSLGCGKGRQDLRFGALTCFVEPNSKILDFGCGFGDLLSFLKNNNLPVKYSGCDAMNVFLDEAKERHPRNDFFEIEVGGDLPNGSYDNIICSGVFNFKYVEDEVRHQEEIYSTIEMLFDRCGGVLSIDFQTPFVDFKVPNSHYQNIESLINFVVHKLSRRFSIDHTYMPYEYCVHIFKDASIKRPDNVFNS
jgi:SAM-dependent methyltransferase